MKYTGVCSLPTLSFDEDGAHNAAWYESLSSWLKGSKCGRASCCSKKKKKKNALLRGEKVCHHASGLKYFAYTAAPEPHSCLV